MPKPSFTVSKQGLRKKLAECTAMNSRLVKRQSVRLPCPVHAIRVSEMESPFSRTMAVVSNRSFSLLMPDAAGGRALLSPR